MSESESERSSDGTPYDSDETVIEHTSYSCPVCGNDSYGKIHDDCLQRCANCRWYYATDKGCSLDLEGHPLDDEWLCKACHRNAVSEGGNPELKEPDEDE